MEQTHRQALPLLLERLQHLEMVDERVLPDHSLLRTRVVWAADSFPELSGPAVAAASASAASAAGGGGEHYLQEGHHHEQWQGQGLQPSSSFPSSSGGGGQLVKPQSPSGPASERRPRSSKIVPTAIEADFARTHSLGRCIVQAVHLTS